MSGRWSVALAPPFEGEGWRNVPAPVAARAHAAQGSNFLLRSKESHQKGDPRDSLFPCGARVRRASQKSPTRGTRYARPRQWAHAAPLGPPAAALLRANPWGPVDPSLIAFAMVLRLGRGCAFLLLQQLVQLGIPPLAAEFHRNVTLDRRASPPLKILVRAVQKLDTKIVKIVCQTPHVPCRRNCQRASTAILVFKIDDATVRAETTRARRIGVVVQTSRLVELDSRVSFLSVAFCEI